MRCYCCFIRRRSWYCRIVYILLATIAPPAWGQNWQWINHFGTTSLENEVAVAADAMGNVFVTGATRGSLAGTNAGDWDVFLRKFNASGDAIWSRQQGTSGVDISFDIKADGAGGAYITGETRGDAFVSRYDAAGNQLWHRLIDSGSGDVGWALSVDHLGNIYVSGETGGDLDGPNQGKSDVFVSKLSPAGDLLWTRQFGTIDSDFNGGVSADGLGNIYVAGSTAGVLDGANNGSFDAFIRKFDDNGNVQWTRQFGTVEEDSIRRIAADQLGNIFVGGETFGSLAGVYSGTEGDAYVSKFNSTGDREWSRQIGTTTLEQLYGLSSDGHGNVFFAGQTRGNLFSLNAGNGDVFFGQLDAAGEFIFRRQFGTIDFDIASGVSADGHGGLYLSGLIGSGATDYDAFVARVPEPATFSIFAMGLLAALGRRSEQRRGALARSKSEGGSFL